MVGQDSAPRANERSLIDLLDGLSNKEQVTRGEIASLLWLAGIRTTNGVEHPTEAMRTDEIAYLSWQLDQPRRSIGSLIAPSPRYALRDLRAEGTIPKDEWSLSAGALITGQEAITLLRGALITAYTTGEPQAIRFPYTGGARLSNGPWFEWEIGERAETSFRESQSWEGESVTSLATRIRFGPNLSIESLLAVPVVFTDSSDAQTDLTLDEARLRFRYRRARGGLQLELAAGREPIGALVADGARLVVTTPLMEVVLHGGFTGWVERSRNATIPTVPNDTVEARDRPLGRGDFAPQRITSVTRVAFPELLGRQSLSLSLFTLLDPFSHATGAPKGRLNLGQVTLSLSGPFSRAIFYDIAGDLQVGRREGARTRQILAFRATAGARWYLNGEIPHRFEARLGLASGARDGDTLDGGSSSTYTGFIPLEDTSPWLAIAAPFSNVGYTELRYRIRPVSVLALEARALFLLHGRERGSFSGREATSPLLSARGNAYAPLGGEFGGKIEFSPMRRMIFELNGNIFLPWTRGAGGALARGSDVMWTTGMIATLQL